MADSNNHQDIYVFLDVKVGDERSKFCYLICFFLQLHYNLITT